MNEERISILSVVSIAASRVRCLIPLNRYARLIDVARVSCVHIPTIKGTMPKKSAPPEQSDLPSKGTTRSRKKRPSDNEILAGTAAPEISSEPTPD